MQSATITFSMGWFNHHLRSKSSKHMLKAWVKYPRGHWMSCPESFGGSRTFLVPRVAGIPRGLIFHMERCPRLFWILCCKRSDALEREIGLTCPQGITSPNTHIPGKRLYDFRQMPIWFLRWRLSVSRQMLAGSFSKAPLCACKKAAVVFCLRDPQK